MRACNKVANIVRVVALCCQFVWLAGAHAAEESNSRPIVLGMSTALSGPSQYLGKSMSDGIRGLIDRVNERGGIRGRRIELLVMDDAYIPELAVDNVRHLIDVEQVVAIIGNVGTPTAEAVVPIVQDRRVVFFGAFTGSSSLRAGDDNDYIFNYRASYEQEMAIIVRHILASNISLRKIAFLLQADESRQLDGFGVAGLEAANTALQQVGFKYTDELVRTTYEANSLQTGYAIRQTLDADYSPEAFILVGSYQPSAHFIRYMYKLYPKANFYNLSFAGAGALADSLMTTEEGQALDTGKRIYMTQVVPPASLALPDLPIDLVQREAHFTAQFFVAALNNISGEIDRESINLVLQKMFVSKSKQASQASGETAISYQNQASDYVVLTRFQNGDWVLAD